MSEKPPSGKIEGVEDNARKFLVGKIDPTFLLANNATSFTLKVDWIEIDAPTETERNSFKPEEFGSKLTEVSTDTRYSGYRITEML